MGKPAMDSRTIKEISMQRYATPWVASKDNRNHRGLPCDEAGWVNVESILKYDNIWRDKHTLAGTTRVNYPVLVERWNNFQRVIFTEYKQTKRIRAQVLGLKVTKGELEYIMDNFDDGLTKRLERRTLRLEIGTADREIWLWPVCNPSPYGAFESPGRCTHRRQQDFLPDEPGSGLYSWGRISLHYIREHRPNFPRRTTSRRRRRPHQYVLRAIRTVGRAKSNGVAIQTDWSNWSRIHLHHVWIHRQVLPSSISRRTHLGPRDNSFRLIWCSMVLRLEGKEVLPSHDHEGKRPDCYFLCKGQRRLPPSNYLTSSLGISSPMNLHPTWANCASSSTSRPVTSVILTDCSLDIRIGMMQSRF